MHDASKDAATLRQQAQQARAEAASLLTELLAHQQQFGAGPADLYKHVSGKSCLERAIDETRRMIEAYDRVLDELDRPAGTVVVGRLTPWSGRGVAV